MQYYKKATKKEKQRIYLLILVKFQLFELKNIGFIADFMINLITDRRN